MTSSTLHLFILQDKVLRPPIEPAGEIGRSHNSTMDKFFAWVDFVALRRVSATVGIIIPVALCVQRHDHGQVADRQPVPQTG